MAAHPSLQSSPVISARNTEHVGVPASWRAIQAVLIGLIALGAIWFATQGYRSPEGDSGRYDRFSRLDLVGFGLLALLVGLTTPTTWTVALTTWQEAIRRKWMTALLGFAVVMLGVSTFFTWMQPGEEQKFLRDYGIGLTVIMTLIAAIFLGVAMIPPEIERRTIFTILSKPVTRLEFLLGKYIGLLITLAFNLLVMSAMFLLAYTLFVVPKDGGEALTGNSFFANIPNWPQALALAWAPDGTGVSPRGLGFDLANLAKALGLQFGNLSIMAALAVMLSQFLTGITATIICFVVYFLGQSSSYWERLSGGAQSDAARIARPVLGETLRRVVDSIYFVLPRLDRFDVRERLVNGLPVGWNYLLKAGSTGAIYAAVLLCIAYFAFSDREF